MSAALAAGLSSCIYKQGFPGGSAVRSPPALQEAQELPVGLLAQEDSLEEGKATHACILACINPWTEGPGRLQSIGSHRVGHV